MFIMLLCVSLRLSESDDGDELNFSTNCDCHPKSVKCHTTLRISA